MRLFSEAWNISGILIWLTVGGGIYIKPFTELSSLQIGLLVVNKKNLYWWLIRKLEQL